MRDLQWTISANPAALTLDTDPGQQVIANIPTADGEIMQVLAQKDANGNPVRLLGYIKVNPSNVTQADAIVLGDNDLPSSVILRDGTSATFGYFQTDTALTLHMPDGHTYTTFLPRSTRVPVRR